MEQGLRFCHARVVTTPASSRAALAGRMGLLLGTLLLLPRAASGANPALTATPQNVEVPAAKTAGSSVIKWDGGDNPYARVYVKVGQTAETLFGTTATGTRVATILVGTPHVFNLYNNPLKSKMLASVTVNAAHPQPPPVTPSGPGNRFQGRPSRGTLEAAQILIRDLKVVPSANNVVVSFHGPPNTVPLLELCKEPPVKGSDGRWGFVPGTGNTTYPVGGNKETGDFRVDIGFITELQPGTTYHFIVNVRTDNTDPNAFRQQTIGTFTTLAQSVNIVFTSIDVVNDSDPDSDGELYFNFWANAGPKGRDYKDPSQGFNRLGTYRKPMHWGDGPHPIDVKLALRNAPDQLTLQVDGRDDDRLPLTDMIGSVTPEPPLPGPGDDGLDEFNVAKETFDLTKHPGASARFEFTIPAMTSSGTDFSFIVHGFVEITRAALAGPPPPAPAPPRAVVRKPTAPFIRR